MEKKIFNKMKSKKKSTGSGRRSAFSGLKILNTDLVITYLLVKFLFKDSLVGEWEELMSTVNRRPPPP
jgi:hypothetical protein